MPEKYSKKLWEILFERYYHDEIIELAKAFPKRRSLVVGYDHLDVCWGARGETSTSAIEVLIHEPDRVFKDANEALRRFVLPIPTPEGWDEAGVEISGFKPEIAIRDIRHKHLNTFVSVTGTLLRKTDVKFNIILACYQCQRCDHKNFVQQQIDGPFIEPFECQNDGCGRKGPFKLIQKESEWVNKRKIRIQETFDQITEGEQILSALDAVLLGNVDCPPLGSTITASGILRGVQAIYSAQKLPDFYPLLNVIHIDVHDAEKTVVITEEDLKAMKELAGDDIIRRLVASTAPSIKGYEAIKEACLCSIVSPDNFQLPDGRELRGHSHVMICGDPSTGKSMIMKAVQNLVPRAQYAAGRGASAKGLTVSVTRDKWSEGAWVAEAGMLVLADRALALIDEMDKYEPEEQQELNTALELGRIPINKAGINREFSTRCPVIGGLNPKRGRFDDFDPIIKQVNVPPDTLSRYDLVFIIYDKPKESDRKIAKHILNLWVKASRKYTSNFRDVKEIIKNWGKDEYAPDISIDMMRKWLAYAKTINVEVTPECARILEEFFMSVRLKGEEGRVPIVFRSLDGMVRLLIAETRLRHGKITTERDVQRVMALVTESFKAIIDPETGKLDVDIILTGLSKSQRDKIKTLTDIIRDLQDEYGSAVPLEDIAAKAEESGIKKETVEDMIQKLKTAGEVYELSHGKYKVA